MKKTNSILDQIEQKIAPSQNSSAIPAGHHNKIIENETERPTLSNEEKSALANVINECFELLRINYHHLYFSAYPEMDAVNSAKRLWLENLTSYKPDIIRKATHALIKQSDYLPTISRLVRKCIEFSSNISIPDTHSAYIEACNASSPKQNYSWSHPAVYYAGQKTNWRYLTSTDEKNAYPIFRRYYEQICEEILSGKELPAIKALALPETIETPLSKKENSERLEKMKAELNL